MRQSSILTGALLFIQSIAAYTPLTLGYPASLDPLTATVYDLYKSLNAGTVTSVQLVSEYVARIEANNLKGYKLRAVIEVAPLSILLKQASKADALRKSGTNLGYLHGIPILIKDNVGTDLSQGLNTTAGSYALLPEYAGVVTQDATIITRLRALGVIILGKTNLSEFANFKGNITNGWSARGGQTQTPYVLGGPFVNGGDPCGSSAGSGAAVAAGWAPIAIGTETDGSIICPSNREALYGIKPSVGIASRAGIVPISHNQDSPGPMGKSTWDVAVLLGGMSAIKADPRDNATISAASSAKSDYVQFLTTSFSGIKLGVPNPDIFFNASYTGSQQIVDEAFAAITKMRSLGASIINSSIPSMNDIVLSNNETVVLNYDFKQDLASYLSELKYNGSGTAVRTLADVIIFNDKHRDIEFAENECCQETLVESVQTTGYSSPEYMSALHFNRDILGRQEGLNAVFAKYPDLTALVLPSEGYSTTPAAIAGFPIATVPLGYYTDSGAPFGLAFIGKQYDEPSLLRVMSAYEANFPARRVPTFRKGTTQAKRAVKLKKRSEAERTL